MRERSRLAKRRQEFPMRVRILLADHSEADFYDMLAADGKPQFAGGLGDPLAHLHDRDMDSDRPGRFFDHAPNPTGRRGATAHHSAGGERSTHKHEAVEFARRIAALLEEGRRAGEFERLVVMAPPAFLGLLREALPQSLRSIVVAEIAKSFVHQPPSQWRSHLPDQVFNRLSPS
jgi:protein required for attachment to host cells